MSDESGNASSKVSRGRLENYLNRVWYERTRPPVLLILVSAGYRMLVAIHRALFSIGLKKVYRSSVPVVVVGNLTVGGTGKTPLVEWLVKQARSLGLTAGIVSRGYGREEDALRVADADATAVNLGDEPYLLWRNTGAPVAVASRRAEAIQKLEPDVDLIILDDGLQHRAVQPDFSIEVVDASRGYGNGFVLPAGPLREPRVGGARIDLTVTRGANYTIRSGTPINIANPALSRPLADFTGEPRLVAVAGIGQPQRFFNTVREAVSGVECLAFPDHHRFTTEDFAQFADACILMTQKDAVKVQTFAGEHWWYVPIVAELDEATQSTIIEQLNRLTSRTD